MFSSPSKSSNEIPGQHSKSGTSIVGAGVSVSGEVSVVASDGGS